MKNIILLLLICLATISVFAQGSKFHERVLSQVNCNDCYFVVLSVRSEQYSGRIVVENDALFSYLKETRQVNRQSYLPLMLGFLRENRELDMDHAFIDESGLFLEGKNLRKSSFRILKRSKSFDAVSTKSCVDLIRHYFAPPVEMPIGKEASACRVVIKLTGKDLLIRPRFDISEQSNLINKLFEEEIPVYRDDISGSLKIAHETLK